MNKWFAKQDGRVVQEELRLERIGGIDDHVVLRRNGLHVRGADALLASIQPESGVEDQHSPGRRLALRPAHVAVLEEDLPVEIREFNLLVVDQAEPSHPGRRQVEGDRRTQTPKADDRDRATFEPLLTCVLDLTEGLVPAMSLGGHRRSASAPTTAW